MAMKIGNLAIVAAAHPECSLSIYDGYATLSMGEGKDRRSYTCRIDDEKRIEEFIAYINFQTPITADAEKFSKRYTRDFFLLDIYYDVKDGIWCPVMVHLPTKRLVLCDEIKPGNTFREVYENIEAFVERSSSWKAVEINAETEIHDRQVNLTYTITHKENCTVTFPQADYLYFGSDGLPARAQILNSTQAKKYFEEKFERKIS